MTFSVEEVLREYVWKYRHSRIGGSTDPVRNAAVVMRRLVNGKSFSEIGREFGITGWRASQVLAEVARSMRRAVARELE